MEHSSGKRDVTCKDILPYVLYVLTVLPICQPALSLSDVHSHLYALDLSCL